VITAVAQRWRDQVGAYVPANTVIDPRDYEVAAILADGPAKAFVLAHHYSGTFPAARFRFGLYRAGALVGVAVFSVPANNRVITNVLPGEAIESVELGRLVLLDDVPGNGESWFVARCFALLRQQGLVGVVSFSDPVPRTDALGRRVFRGHIGNVYQALNAVYTGRGKADTLRLLPDGAVFSARAASKIRQKEQGARYAVAQLVAHGAEPLDVDGASEGERRAWLTRWRETLTRPLRHGGCHKYVWALDRRAKRHLPPAQPYPKLLLAA
jgi:hypothetical protein